MKPFPLDCLPRPVAEFAADQAAAMSIKPEMLVGPCLATAAAAIGMTRAARLRSSWIEFLVLWCLLVVRSGSLKTPAIKNAIAPLVDAQKRIATLQAEDFEAYDVAKLKYERALQEWKRGKDNRGEPPTKPLPPEIVRHVINDCTIESLTYFLPTSPKLLAYIDEGAGFFKAQNQYKAGGKGSDTEAWLAFYNGGLWINDRAKNGGKPIIIDNAGVSIIAGIQPGIYQAIMRGQHTESGMKSRFLVCSPPPSAKRWAERDPNHNITRAWFHTIDKLLMLQSDLNENGSRTPRMLDLEPQALSLWRDYVNRQGDKTFEALKDAEAASLSKMEGVSARLAGIFALINKPSTSTISVHDIHNGIQVSEWFENEAARLHVWSTETDEDREARELIEWIERRGKPVSARDLSRADRKRFPTTLEADATLEQFAKAGLGTYKYPPPTDRGGKPARVFISAKGQNHANTPFLIQKQGYWQFTPLYMKEMATPTTRTTIKRGPKC
ncbi:MAG: DUF3987 domain-containing protein [Planctomycetes bacterium]|nr:DUF3987 domain-containing protein [Planctomycetota bacterium]